MKILSKSVFALAAMLLLAPIFTTIATADSGVIVKSNGAKKFVALPDGAIQPEGIAVNSTNGEVIVGTFAPPAPEYSLLRYSSEGDLLANVIIPQSNGAMLGLAYHDGYIYICNSAFITNVFTRTDAEDILTGVDAGPSRIQRIRADFTDVSTLETVTAGVDPEPTTVLETVFLAPNDLTFDDDGNLYFSDSFLGAVFMVARTEDEDPFSCAPTCEVVEVANHELLRTTGFPPFGANGVAIKGNTLFVANTGNDTVMTIPLDQGFPAEPTVLAQSVNGADGVIYDSYNDLLWIAANQADHVVGINPSDGSVVAQIGAFLGVKGDGSARGLIFPASLVEVANGKILVTNLAIPLGSAAGEPEGNITKFTVSRINIPEFDD